LNKNNNKNVSNSLVSGRWPQTKNEYVAVGDPTKGSALVELAQSGGTHKQ